jgi:hypothetical protein
MIDDKKITCNILLCGYNEKCGQNDVQDIITSLFSISKMLNLNIVKSSNFFKIYPTINIFQYIILCRRNMKDFTNKFNDYSKYIEMFNCWSLFASLIIPYESSTDSKIELINIGLNNLGYTNNTKFDCYLRSNNYLL